MRLASQTRRGCVRSVGGTKYRHRAVDCASRPHPLPGNPPPVEKPIMSISNEGILIIILIGIIAGWLAGKIVDGGGFGLIGDLVVGILGAFIGNWLLPRLNIHLGFGIVSQIINATLGAIVLLAILRLLGGRRWGR
jgi:uncharacterized membrane protein YeaQ/YmgE (transglycosylase-associated protein family)